MSQGLIGHGAVIAERLPQLAGETDSSGGIALLLLILIVGAGIWIFRRATRDESDPGLTTAADIAPWEPPGVLRVAIWATLATTLLGLVLPALTVSFTDDGVKLSDAGGEIVVYFIVAWLALIIGGEIKRSTRSGLAIAQGAAIALGGYVLLIATAFGSVIHLSEGFVEVGVGLVLLFLGAAACIWVVALRRPAGSTRRAAPVTGALITLVIGAGLTTLGTMLPPNDSGLSFSDVNFSWNPFVLQIAWYIFLASMFVPAWLALRDRTRVGLGLATGALAPTAWLAITTLIDSDGGSDFTNTPVSDTHPLFLVGALVQLIAVIVAYSSADPDQPAVPAAPATDDGTPEPDIPPPPPLA